MTQPKYVRTKIRDKRERARGRERAEVEAILRLGKPKKQNVELPLN